MTKKPSPNQLAVLRAIAIGSVLEFHTRVRALGWFHLRGGRVDPSGLWPKVDRRTAHSLIKNGWVEIAEQDYKSRCYRLTTAGQSALGKH